MIVCICNNVSDRKIRQAVDAGMTSMVELRDHLDIGTLEGNFGRYPNGLRISISKYFRCANHLSLRWMHMCVL